MGLPQIPIESKVVEVHGAEFKIRALTAAEWDHCLNLHKQGKTRDARARLIAHATDTTVDEVRDWFEQVPGGVLEDLAYQIELITGVGPDAQFRGGTGPGSGGDGSV